MTDIDLTSHIALDAAAARAVRSDTSRASDSPRRNRPVLWWASFGVAIVALQLYVYSSWILSDDFKPVPTGTDPVPHADKVWAWILQPLFTLWFLATLIWIMRKCRREGRLSFDAMLFIAALAQVWLDPAFSYVRTQFFFHSYYLNRGSWVEHIPGWISPNGHLIPDPLLAEPTLYGCLVVVFVLGTWFMTQVRRRRPQTSYLTLLLSTWVLVAAFIMVFEFVFVLLPGWAVWNADSPVFTAFFGTRHEMSLLPDPVFWGGFMLAGIALRFYYQQHGRTPWDASLERVRVSARTKTALRTSAVIGYMSAAMLVAVIFANVTALWTQTPRNIPTYLRNGICGQGTPNPCPDKGVPIPTAAKTVGPSERVASLR
jgi:hypothetical protein